MTPEEQINFLIDSYELGLADSEPLKEIADTLTTLLADNKNLTSDFRDSGNKINALMASNKDLHEQVAALESRERPDDGLGGLINEAVKVWKRLRHTENLDGLFEALVNVKGLDSKW